MIDFGASFRKARESAGISIDQASMETRISSRFLKAIEDEEFHILPGGIFNRGFVRAYADHLGIDPENAVADYERAAALRQPSEPLTTSASRRFHRKSKGPLYPIVLATLALLLVMVLVTVASGKW